MPDFFAPLTALLGTLLALTHTAATTVVADGAIAWIIAIGLLTVAVRLALLPVAVRGARNARRSAAAAPAMRELQRKYADKHDPDSLQQMLTQRREIQREHGLSALGCLPMVLQMPVFFSLYHLMLKVSGGASVGALTTLTLASATAASIGGVQLGSRLLAGSLPQAAIVLGLAVVAGLATFATQRWFGAPVEAEGPMAAVQAIMPWLSLGGVVLGAFFVPAGLVLYWAYSNVWTLGQQAMLNRGLRAAVATPGG